MGVNVIGGADGPTSIFIAGKIGADWFNLFGLLIIVLLMLPNMIYALKYKDAKTERKHKIMTVVEQIGRYASILFMVFHFTGASINIFRFIPFVNQVSFFLYFFCLAGSIVLVILYYLTWMLYFIEPKFWKSMSLAVIPIIIFLLSGIAKCNYPLIISAIVFGIGHIYITYQSRE